MGKKITEQEVLEKRKISAAEAKSIAETSRIPLSLIYKCIRAEAKEGRMQIDWLINNMAPACLEFTKAALLADGYSVLVNEDEKLLSIKW